MDVILSCACVRGIKSDKGGPSPKTKIEEKAVALESGSSSSEEGEQSAPAAQSFAACSDDSGEDSGHENQGDTGGAAAVVEEKKPKVEGSVGGSVSSVPAPSPGESPDTQVSDQKPPKKEPKEEKKEKKEEDAKKEKKSKKEEDASSTKEPKASSSRESAVAPVRASQADRDREEVTKFAAAATAISQVIEKFPSGGRGMFTKAKKRYLAAVPAGAGSKVEHWKKGKVKWFESEKEFQEHHKESGSMDFANVVGVEHLANGAKADAGRGVAIEHKEDGKATKLVILLPTEPAAKEWTRQFDAFIKALQK